MDKLQWKSFISPAEQYKAEETAEPETPTTSEGLAEQGLGELAELWGLNSDSSTTADVPDQLSLTSGTSTLTPGTSVDPLTGEIVVDESTNPFPSPTVSEVKQRAAENGMVLKSSDIDSIRTMYEQALDKYTKIRVTIVDSLSGGGLSAAEVAAQQALLKALDESIAKIKQALVDLDTVKEEIIQNNKEEMALFKEKAKEIAASYNACKTWQEREKYVELLATADKDLNGMIGTDIKICPDTDCGKVLYSVKDDKFISFISKTGSVSSVEPPDSTWTLSTTGLEISEEKIGTEDFALELSGNSLTGSALGGAKYDFCIPDTIIVKKDGDDFKTVERDGETHYVPATLEMTTDGKIVQNTRDDAEKYAQVKVAEVEVYSDKDKKDEDHDGYDQVAKLYDRDGVIIAEIRFTNRDGNFAASTCPPIFDFNQRTESVIFSSKDMISTGRLGMSQETLNSFYEEYGVDGRLWGSEKNTDKLSHDDKIEQAKVSFSETMNKFTGTTDDVKEGSLDATGSILVGFMGHATLGNGSNCVFTKDPAKVYDQDKREGKEEDENPLFSNVIEGGANGYNAVFASGKGNLYATEMTMTWSESKNRNAINAVTVKTTHALKPEDGEDNPSDYTDYEVPNIQSFAFLGGRAKAKSVYNPSDTDTARKTPEEKTGDDYYDTEGQGSFALPAVGASATVADPDADSTLGGSAEGSGVVGAIDIMEAGSKIDDAVTELAEETDDPYAELEYEIASGEMYQTSMANQESFFSAISEALGMNTAKNSDSGDVSDDPEAAGDELAKEAEKEPVIS